MRHEDVASRAPLDALAAAAPIRRGSGPWLSNLSLRLHYREHVTSGASLPDRFTLADVWQDVDERLDLLAIEVDARADDAEAAQLLPHFERAAAAEAVAAAYAKRAAWVSPALSQHGRLQPF